MEAAAASFCTNNSAGRMLGRDRQSSSLYRQKVPDVDSGMRLIRTTPCRARWKRSIGNYD